MTKTTKTIKFATYVNIWTNMEYMFIMTINQSVNKLTQQIYFLIDSLIYRNDLNIYMV